MKKTRYILHLTWLLLAITLLLGLGSCGTTRAHFGIDHDVAYNWNGGYFEDGGGHGNHHKKPKPPKQKHHKPKKHKPGKHHHD